MNAKFSAIEAVKIALNQEKDGYTYYETALEQIKDNTLEPIIQRLANDEKEHEKIFQKIHDELEAKGDVYFDIDDEMSHYLSTYVKTIFLKNMKNIKEYVQKLKSDLDVLTHAIQNEKDTILFFMELKDLANDSDAKEVFTRIIQEERKHVITLEKAYSERKKEVLGD